jgi:DNA-binding response OmpR family regulator
MSSSTPKLPRVLIVEDDIVQSDLLTKVARRSGCEAVCAYRGEQALSILREAGDEIDAVLTDIRLPGIVDGWVVGAEFTLHHPLRPVIYISGIEEDSGFRRSVGSVFLQKPVNVADLSARFRELTGSQ